MEKQGNGLQTYTLGKNESTTNTLAKSKDAPHFFVLSNCPFYFALAPLLLENFAKRKQIAKVQTWEERNHVCACTVSRDTFAVESPKMLCVTA